MGIPRFAPWISKKYPNMVAKHLPEAVEGLYIDMNGIIHPCCHDEDDPSRAAAPEDEKIERICWAVDELVAIARPTRILHLAMDGVAPRAKMNQQRARRYTAASERYGAPSERAGNMAPRETSFTEEEHLGAARVLREARESLDFGVYDAALDEAATGVPGSGGSDAANPLAAVFPSNGDLAALTDVADAATVEAARRPYDEAEFDSNCISPGTAFMDRASQRLKEFVQAKVNSDDSKDEGWKGLMVVWSDSQVPGEGEHKIIDFLRTQASHPGGLHGGAHVIVGLDADLILLCLSLHLPNIFIMRDSKRVVGTTCKVSPSDVAGVIPDGEEISGMGHRTHSHSHATSPLSSPARVGAPQFNGDANSAIAEALSMHKATDSSTRSHPRRKFEYYDISQVATSVCTEMHTLAASLGILGVRPDPSVPAADSVSAAAKGAKKKSAPGALKAAARSTRGGVSAVLEVGTATVIDDFVVLATLMGNDFMPRLPSAFCGNMAMDNFMEVYVRAVLPFGPLTTPGGDVRLSQLQRFLEGYAMVEAMLFRRHMADTKVITYDEAAAPVGSPVDESFRALYYNTTSIRTRADVEMASRKYVEGVRFVWRYYSTTSQQCSWTWFYPYHHAPFASDVAKFLHDHRDTPLAAPALESEAPSPFVQLLCILPPTSCKLLPQPFRALMLNPPKDLADTFCRKWAIDFAAANGKTHLATVLIPFADLVGLQRACEKITEAAKASGALTADELRRAQNTTRAEVFVHTAVESLSHTSAASSPSASPTSRHPTLRGDVTPIAPGKFSIADTAPLSSHAARPTYAVTTYVRNLPLIANLPVRLQPQREPPETAKRGRRGNKKSKEQESNQERDRGINLSDFMIAIGAALVAACALGGSVGVLELVGVVNDIVFIVATAVVGVLWLGAGVHNPLSGSSIVRNTIRDAYVDWLCAECLSMNFARNESCFQCRHPFEESTSWAVFSSKIPQSPPLMDPNHRSYCTDVHLRVPDGVYATAVGASKNTAVPEGELEANTPADLNVDMM